MCKCLKDNTCSQFHYQTIKLSNDLANFTSTALLLTIMEIPKLVQIMKITSNNNNYK